MTKIQLFVFAILCTVAKVSAYYYGAGQCNTKSASVAQSHLAALTTLTGGLEKGNFTVTVNGQVLSATSLNYIHSGVALNVSVFPNAPSPGFFRGFLIRIGPNIPGAFTTISYLNSYPTDTTVAVFCSPCSGQMVAGICHFNNNNKTLASGAMTIPSPMTGLIMDVNVVVANRNNYSQYYYDYFELSAVAPGAPTGSVALTPAPTPGASGSSTTTKPVAPPTGSMTTAPPSSTAKTTAPASSSAKTTAPAPTPVVISSQNKTTTGTKSSSLGGTSSAPSSRVFAAFTWMTVVGSFFVSVF